jgi:hypothetical protein
MANLGPYQSTLKVGKAQSMVFLDGNIGPFWMTETKGVHRHLDKPMGEFKEHLKTTRYYGNMSLSIQKIGGC